MHDLPSTGLIVLCGPPCAGKSTFAAAHFDRWDVVSFDHYCRVAGSSGGAVRVMAQIVVERLRLQESCRTVIDATYLLSESRRQALQIAAALAVPASIIAFDAPLETLRLRSLAQPDPISARDMEACYRKWERARRDILTEGWDAVRFEPAV